MLTTGSAFYRLDADQRQTFVTFENLYAGTSPSACWLIGGGPGLNTLPCEAIAASPLPKLALNLAGVGKLRPTFWTSYDPTVRFLRSIYLDPGILKFVHRRRAMDLVPESDAKVCDCPGTVFFDRDVGRGFGNFLDPESPRLIDWADSMVQGIDLLYRLGFRTIYLAGCDMRVLPSPEQMAHAERAGVNRDDWFGFSDFVKVCQSRGMSPEELAGLAAARAYHFDETKSFAATVQTDAHYFRIAQGLRLSRRCLAQQGLQLISVTPGSRLNEYFPFVTVDEALATIHEQVGNPRLESPKGLYTQLTPRQRTAAEPMRDIKPPNWPMSSTPAQTSRSRKPVAVPDLAVDGEGWQPCSPRFQDAYVPPDEHG